MTAAVPDPREGIDWSAHRGSCRVFYAERRCTCAAVPDPGFRDQLAKKIDEVIPDLGHGWALGLADLLMPTIAAEVEARVEAAANQRAAEELEAAARGVMAGATEVAGLPVAVRQALTIAATTLSARAAALASPAPGNRALDAT